ncbi:(Fe-S)-binding protein [[Clostridium] dakarense]|uniref:(Fe-S)-binding protein n=1 Tax=Faecalimicrobium dakarense TaxID=1301100 RepID=UPI0004B498DB|nr:(Fe-S)-binding protein [[Clostridium] dakarense]
MHKIDLSKGVLKDVNENNKNCINCKICFNSCPMMKEYSSSPKELLQSIIDNGMIDKKIPYSCMLCDVCTIKCPKDINLKNMFYDIRKDIFENNLNIIDDIGYKTVKFHQTNSFSPIFSKRFINKTSKKIFFPGCSLSSYSSDIVLKTYDYLKSNIDNISLVFECCGKPTLSMGDMDKFNEYYSKLDFMFNENDIYEVIVACPNCFKTIGSHSENVKVRTLWEVIKEYGVPKELQDYYKDVNLGFSLHDPCPVRNESKVHESVRYILESLGVKVVEFDKNKEKSECCGSGGMVKVTNKELANKQTRKRANEAKTENIVTYCEACCESMLSVEKQTLHILDFMFNEDVINKKKFTQDKKSTIKKWSTRYKGIKLAKKTLQANKL